MKKIIFHKTIKRIPQLFEVEIKLKNGNLSITGYAKLKNDVEFGGQCQDEFNEYLKGNSYWDKLYSIWNEWHLNDMQPGTPEQMQCLKNITKEEREKAIKHLEEKYKQIGSYKNDPECKYNQDCLLLEWHNLYKVEMPDGTKYKYGYKWLKKELPEYVIKFINDLPTSIQTN